MFDLHTALHVTIYLNLPLIVGGKKKDSPPVSKREDKLNNFIFNVNSLFDHIR